MKMTVFDPWSAWAKVIKTAKLTEFERHEAVREMLGALISTKNKFSLTESELRVAAEKALEWTRQEERNLAMARVLNSPEMKSCLDSIASGKGRKEATRQYAALISKTFV
jgi:VIT1/CCC1 family predicted Fe2+/Mn2+ transporter